MIPQKGAEGAAGKLGAQDQNGMLFLSADAFPGEIKEDPWFAGVNKGRGDATIFRVILEL